MRSRVSLSDVAAAANVSVGTVSNVLNSPERVRPATRDRVYEAMQALGYRSPGIIFPAETATALKETAGDATLPLLVSVGYISVDFIARIGVMPHRGDRVSARQIAKRLGGPAANVAVAAAALGAPYPLEVELATAIGKDADSLWALELLARRGVRARAVRSPFRERLSRCIVLVEENGERTKINEPLALNREDLISHLPSDPVRRRSHLHFEGYHAETMTPALPSLRERGWTLSLHDTGLPPDFATPDRFSALLGLVDKIFLNRRTAYLVLGQQLSADRLIHDMSRYLKRCGAPACEVVVTLGMDGAAVFPAGAPTRIERAAAPSVRIVDGTGAGDGFVGAYLGQWLHGEDGRLAAARACVAASLIMTAEGAQGRPSSLRDIEAHLNKETA